MSNPNAKPPVEHQWKPGQSGNPKGMKKGTKHISTWIQDLLNDEKFEYIVLNADDQKITYKGAPIAGIIGVAVVKAMRGDQRWADWLAKYGYGMKINVNTTDPVQEVLEKFGLIEAEGDNDAGQTEDATG